MLGQAGLHLGVAVARDEHQPSLDLVRVENLDELAQLSRRHGGANLRRVSV